ncbi:MAG: hypothetical protein DMG79_06915 [Acidobacteria bacterium]|nr:MAG: hypothetical protein DMG79_06915 [Acidobacteriota bacterium]
MKKDFVVSAVLLLVSLPSSGSHSQPSVSSQMKLKRSHEPTSVARKTPARKNTLPVGHPAAPAVRPVEPAKTRAQARSSKPRKFSSSPSGTTGLVSAAQIAMGGADDDSGGALLGDFNGDGKKDVAKLVYNNVSSTTIYSVSVILGNGDGTFQAAQLTATPSDTDDPIVVGDVNGDGKDDIIMIHPYSGGCATGHKSAPVLGCGSTFDVMLSNGDGTFTLGNNYFVSGYTLNGGLLTDVNADGKLDILAIDSETPGLVISVLGNGDGTFQSPTTAATLTAAAPNQIVFADFNGDGKLDFSGEIGNQVNVFLATGSTFAEPVALETSDTVHDTCGDIAGDLNGDSKPEIISLNCGDNTVTVYLNNGEGSFQTGVYYDNAGDQYMYPYHATVADMNADGKNDIVLGNSDAGDITILLGNGDGTLMVPTVGYGTGGYPWTAPVVADFNGDGLMDIVEPDDYYSFVYLEGYGDGSLRASVSYFLPNSFGNYGYTYSVASGDFNGDGISDVVAGQDGNTIPGIVVYLSNPDGTLQPGISYGTSNTFSYVMAADFNGDGKLDIAATDYANGTVQIFLGNGDGTFTPGQSYATDASGSPYPENLVAGDFNHDGKLDLAVLNASSDTVGVLFGVGDGTFGQLSNYSLSGYGYGIAAADVNGDGYLDLVITAYNNSDSNVDVLLGNNDNSGTFQTETNIVTGTGFAEYVAVGDLNGDGKLDLAVSMNNGPVYPGAIVVTLGNGDGTFQAPVAYPSSTQAGGLGYAYTANVQTADFDGDGNLDLIYVNYYYGTVGIMAGIGDGTFASPVEFPAAGYIWGMSLADVNGDGTVDVVVGNDYVGGVSVLLNGNGSGTAQNYTFVTQTPTATVAAGASVTYDLTLAGRNGYNGTITFACTGLPAKAACSFSPASVVADGNLPLSTTLTISTAAATSRANSNTAAPLLIESLSAARER